MPLYGHELSAETMANEVGLDFAIKSELEFIGQKCLSNPPKYQRVGLKLVSKGIAREHSDIFDENGNLVGVTTSGGVCPTLNGAYAMARVKIDLDLTKPLFIDVRGRKLHAEITEMPFYKRK